jgi:cell wall-associated NlpC family hydrolase
MEELFLKLNTRCVIYLLILFTLLAGFPAIIEAASQAQLNAEQQLEKQTQQQLNKNATNINSTEAQLISLKTSLNALDQSISKNQADISKERTDLQGLQAQESNGEAVRSELVQNFDNFLVFTYEEGDTGYLTVLLNSTSWEDFVWRYEAVKSVLDQNLSLQNNIISQNQIIDSQKETIGRDMTSLQAAVQQEDQMAALKKQTTSNEQVVLSGLSSKQRQMEETKLAQLNTISDIQQELADQQREAEMAAQNGPIKSTPGIPQITQSVVVGSGKIASMISFAESFIGTPYVWSGTSPRPGFDCSGFTQYVLRYIGVNIQRTTQEQCIEGTPVAKGNLEPGDLIFFSTYTSGASHVGICIGNDLMVDSEASGVIIANYTNAYWAPRYLDARRIVQ